MNVIIVMFYHECMPLTAEIWDLHVFNNPLLFVKLSKVNESGYLQNLDIVFLLPGEYHFFV